MRSAILLAASVGIASAQFFQPSQDPNAPCGIQPFGYGPPSAPPTDQGFLQNPALQYSSLLAPAPQNYTASFRNLTGATSQSNYMGYYVLPTYNTSQCAGYCNGVNGCNAFNIYYERDPSVNPADNCPNPFPFNNIKCSLWGSSVSKDTATNQGQYRQQFHVVIAGSDGFNKN